MMMAVRLCSCYSTTADHSHGRRASSKRAMHCALRGTPRIGSASVYSPLHPPPIQRRGTLRRATSGCGGDGGGGAPPVWQSTAEEGDDSRPGRLPQLFALALIVQLSSARPAHALFKKRQKKKSLTIDDYSDQVVTLFWPICQNLGFSGAIGLATALALKTVGRTLAIILGVLFAIIQGLAYTGYITVNWTTVHKDVIKRLDVNKSGKFDASDVKSLTASALAVLSQGVPSTGGFCAGLLLGLK